MCKYSLFFTGLLLTACASSIPETIRQAPADNPDIQQVQKQPENFISKQVRWGGIIVDIQNRPDSSQLSIVAFPLTKYGEPAINDNSLGRFIAITDEFLEPTVYIKDRQITVVGEISGSETKNIGEFSYPHVVIKIKHHYLWPVEQKTSYDDYPPPYWWYDPWYPWYPYYPYRPYRY